MAEFNITTTTKWSSTSARRLRSASEFEREVVDRDALLLGAPIALLVLALSSMFFITMLRWKMRDRLRRTANTSDTNSIMNGSPQPQTAEEGGLNFSSFANTMLPTSHRDGVVIRLLVSADGRTVAQSPYELGLAAMHPPPSYDVAVIYGGYRLNHAYDPSHFPTGAPHSTVDDMSETCRPPTYNDVISRSVPDVAVNDCNGVSIT